MNPKIDSIKARVGKFVGKIAYSNENMTNSAIFIVNTAFSIFHLKARKDYTIGSRMSVKFILASVIIFMELSATRAIAQR